MSVTKQWQQIIEGDVVEGSQNSLWSVDKVEGGTYTLLNVMTGELRPGTPPPDKDVVVVIESGHALDTAITLSKVILGGQELGVRNAQGEWICPAEIDHAGAMYSHLLHFHAIYGGGVAEKTIGYLTELHARIHDPQERAGGYVEHVHGT
jgi:hypothetical protein